MDQSPTSKLCDRPGGDLTARFERFRKAHLGWVDGWVYRDRQEILDLEPQSPGALKVVRDLESFGRITGLNRQIAAVIIERLKRRANISRPARLIDLCTGHGGFCRYLARRARSNGLSLEITAVDHSAAIIESASAYSPEVITWRIGDALRLADADKSFDLAINIQSLHHFGPAEVVGLLREMDRVAEHLFLFDLRRTAYGFIAMNLVRPFYSKEFLHDGQISHRRAYSIDETAFLIAEASIKAAVRPFMPVGLAIETADPLRSL